MIRFFIYDIICLVGGLIYAYCHGGIAVAVSVLAIVMLEISISFDNAVVNAVKLSKMSKVWRRRFLTWGILIAVFGMRFLFPVLLVAIFAEISMGAVIDLALHNPDEYSAHLSACHYAIASFGSMFLLMLFLGFMFEKGKAHWLKMPELALEKIGKIPFSKEICGFLLLGLLQIFLQPEQRLVSILVGTVGILLHFAIEAVAAFFDKRANMAKNAAYAGLVSFLYLELIDASFSLDGVLGAFALSKDVIIITIGLAVGAMFVRSLTVVLVEHKTLDKFPYLQNGAYWAVGALSFIMLYSAFAEVSDDLAAIISVLFIVSSLISSFMQNRKISINLRNLKIGRFRRFRIFK